MSPAYPPPASQRIGEPHVVAGLWALLTLSFATHVALRWSLGEAPTLGTLSACGAITAVWLYFPVHYRDRIGLSPRRSFRRSRGALLVVLAAVVVAEWTMVAQELARRGTLRLIPAASAFVFTSVFRHLLLGLLADSDPASSPGG